jgi:RNA polymerase sigma-70 factor (ECF subfamily)
VFDYSLEEIADLVDSTVGGVKAALSRGRSRLGKQPETAETALRARDELRELISADARLRVADRFAGHLIDSPYFGNYQRWKTPWRMAVGDVDGEPVVVILEPDLDQWAPKAFVRFETTNGQIVRISDYLHCPWILPAATSVAVENSPE